MEKFLLRPVALRPHLSNEFAIIENIKKQLLFTLFKTLINFVQDVTEIVEFCQISLMLQ
jgi:hypothetical protein